MKEILHSAMRAGVKFHLDGEELRISAPPGAMDDALRQKIRDIKAGLIELLRANASLPSSAGLPAVEHDPQQRHAPFPLTDVQHAYWMGRKNLAELGNVATHFYFELDCPQLDIARFNQALCRLIDRHEMLRAIMTDDGLQQILPSVPAFDIVLHDVAGESEAGAEKRVMQLREQMSHEVRPANQWPLFDVQASAMPNGHTRLHLSLDMLILDGWSMFLMFSEWFQLYRSPALSLPALQLSYRDYVIAERKLLEGAAYQRARDYWMKRIDTLPPAPDLPIVTHAPSATPRFSRRRERVERARWSRLKEQARANGLTASGLLLAVYAEVLARWSGSAHFTLNLTLFNRLPLHPEVMHLLGDFTSLVMVEVDHREPGTSFLQRAQQLQHRLMDDLEHREFSGVEVLRESNHRRHTGMQAVMPVVFTSALVLGGKGNEDAGLVEQFGPMVYGVSQTPQVWLDNQIMEVNGDLVFNWDAVDAMFEQGVLDAMFGSFLQALQCLADEDALWSQASVLALPGAMQARREAANATATPAQMQLLHADFLAWAAKTPDAPAVITASRTLNYRQLLAESVAVANRLHAQGVQPGELVAVMMQKGWEQVVAVLGTLIAGAAYMPVDAALPRARQLSLLEIGEVRFVLTQPGLPPASERGAFEERYALLDVAPGSAAPMAADVPPARQMPADLAYVIFTSGTTGVPKGVAIDHQAACNTITHINRMHRVGPADRVLAVSSLSFDLSVYDIFGLLGAGGALVIPEHGQHLDAVAWKKAITEHDVTLWNSAPQSMRMLMDTFGPDERSAAPLRTVLLSGDWIPLELPARIATHYANARVTSLGGATEASIWSNFYAVDTVDPAWVSIPYGMPLPNQNMWVLDHQMSPCPDHVIGRIFIGGTGLARGYWRDAEKTAARFVTHPRTRERLYDTGDLGRYAQDGNIIFLGRDDNQVKIRGHRVELGEIAAVLRHHPDVEEAAVIATGPKERRALIGYIQLNPISASELGTRLAPAEKASAGALSLRASLGEALTTSNPRMLDALFEKTWSLLDQLYLSAAVNTLMHFGVQGVEGERIILDRIMAQGVADRYRRWLQRALNALVEDGYARAWGSGVVEITCALPGLDASGLNSLTMQLEQRLQADLDFTKQECDWLFDIVRRIPDILTEDLHSAQLYAADHTAQLYHKMFPNSHADLARVVQQIVRLQGDGLNVIEVGGGLGTATQHVLPVLAEHRCHYAFTDISEFFLTRAHQLFDSEAYARNADNGFTLDFGLLDLDIRPEFQGYQSHGYDVALASSMLHDVRDIKQALGNLRSLLKPGGHLLILEQTRFFRSFDLQGGLQQNFDSFQDEPLRTVHPLLSREQWETVLRDTGFADVAIIGTAGTVADYLGFHVIVAKAPNELVQLRTEAVAAYLADHLPEYMVPTHMVQMERMPISSNGKIDYKALPMIPEEAVFSNRQKVAPRTATEQALLDIWLRLMPGHEVGVTDNFFDIGGDSLIATQVIREINQSLSFNLEMNDFFENMSIEALAKLYDSRKIVIDIL